MSLGLIRGAWKVHQKRNKNKDMRTIEPTGSIEMNIPVTFVITAEELDKYGWSPEEQSRNNPRIRNALKKVI